MGNRDLFIIIAQYFADGVSKINGHLIYGLIWIDCSLDQTSIFSDQLWPNTFEILDPKSIRSLVPYGTCHICPARCCQIDKIVNEQSAIKNLKLINRTSIDQDLFWHLRLPPYPPDYLIRLPFHQRIRQWCYLEILQQRFLEHESTLQKEYLVMQ